jgi:acyl dehydratase
MKYFEDIVIGVPVILGRHTFTAEEIKRFATRFDPQLFHIDEEAAKASHFGALIASGWHTAAVWMRYAAAFRTQEEAEQRARGEPLARRGPSPGFRELKWLRPVYVGDTLTFATTAIEKRVSGSRPEWGIVTSLNTGTNQAGDLAYSFIGTLFVERRPGAGNGDI